MPFTINVVVRASAGDLTIISDPFSERAAAIEDIEKIRRSRQLYLLDRTSQAENALPTWLVTDPSLVLVAWLNQSDPSELSGGNDGN